MKFLAAVDLSEASLLGLDALATLSAPDDSEVTLLHVVDLDLYTAGGSVPGIMEFAEERLSAESKRLSACGFRANVRVEQGDATQTILRVAAEENADLVVMTNLGKGAGTGRLFGSTAERVSSHGSVPVFIERVSFAESGACCRARDGGAFARMLVAVELDEAAAIVLAFVKRLHGVEAMRVVHAVPDAERASDARMRLEDLVAGVAGVSAEDVDVVVGNSADAVLGAAREWKATTIALSPCAHTALHRALWGSVARAIALHAPCSVLFVPQVAIAH